MKVIPLGLYGDKLYVVMLLLLNKSVFRSMEIPAKYDSELFYVTKKLEFTLTADGERIDVPTLDPDEVADPMIATDLVMNSETGEIGLAFNTNVYGIGAEFLEGYSLFDRTKKLIVCFKKSLAIDIETSYLIERNWACGSKIHKLECVFPKKTRMSTCITKKELKDMAKAFSRIKFKAKHRNDGNEFYRPLDPMASVAKVLETTKLENSLCSFFDIMIEECSKIEDAAKQVIPTTLAKFEEISKINTAN